MKNIADIIVNATERAARRRKKRLSAEERQDAVNLAGDIIPAALDAVSEIENAIRDVEEDDELRHALEELHNGIESAVAEYEAFCRDHLAKEAS